MTRVAVFLEILYNRLAHRTTLCVRLSGAIPPQLGLLSQLDQLLLFGNQFTGLCCYGSCHNSQLYALIWQMKVDRVLTFQFCSPCCLPRNHSGLPGWPLVINHSRLTGKQIYKMQPNILSPVFVSTKSLLVFFLHTESWSWIFFKNQDNKLQGQVKGYQCQIWFRMSIK